MAKNKATHTGTVKVWVSKGYGFIRREDGLDVFVHISSLQYIVDKLGVDNLKGLPLTFQIKETPKGPRATDIGVVEDVRYEVRADPATFRGDIHAPIVIEITFWGNTEVSREKKVVTKPAVMERAWPEWLRQKIRPLAQAFNQAPTLGVRGLDRKVHLVIGDQRLTEEELSRVEVVDIHHPHDGRRDGFWVVVRHPRFSDEVKMSLANYEGVINDLTEAGVLQRTRCVYCKLPLLTQDPNQRVHTDANLGPKCDDRKNGALRERFWKNFREAVKRHTGLPVLPEGTTEEVGFYPGASGPMIVVPREGKPGMVYWAWKDVLEGCCRICGEPLVNVRAETDRYKGTKIFSKCSYCDRVNPNSDRWLKDNQDPYANWDPDDPVQRSRRVLSQLAWEGEEPRAPLAEQPVDQSELTCLAQKALRFQRIGRGLEELGRSVVWDKPQAGLHQQIDQLGLRTLLRRGEEMEDALSHLPPELERANKALVEAKTFLSGFGQSQLDYLAKLGQSYELLDEAEGILVKEPCPHCGKELETGYSGMLATCFHSRDRLVGDRFLGMVFAEVVNERGEVLTRMETPEEGDHGFGRMNVSYGDVDVFGWYHLKSASGEGLWDGVTPFSEIRLQRVSLETLLEAYQSLREKKQDYPAILNEIDARIARIKQRYK